jgi:hypothetical protein
VHVQLHGLILVMQLVNSSESYNFFLCILMILHIVLLLSYNRQLSICTFYFAMYVFELGLCGSWIDLRRQL